MAVYKKINEAYKKVAINEKNEMNKLKGLKRDWDKLSSNIDKLIRSLEKSYKSKGQLYDAYSYMGEAESNVLDTFEKIEDFINTVEE